MTRSFPIALACILLLIFAAIGITGGAILVFGEGTLGGLVEETATELEEQFSLRGTYIFGMLAIIWSGLGSVAAYGLWGLRKWGARLAIILSLIAIGISIWAQDTISIIYIPFSVLIIVLVATGWKRLTPPSTAVSE